MRRLQGQYLDIKRRLSDGDGAAIDPVTIRMESTPEGFCGVCGAARCVWVAVAPFSPSRFVCGDAKLHPSKSTYRPHHRHRQHATASRAPGPPAAPSSPPATIPTSRPSPPSPSRRARGPPAWARRCSETMLLRARPPPCPPRLVGRWRRRRRLRLRLQYSSPPPGMPLMRCTCCMPGECID